MEIKEETRDIWQVMDDLRYGYSDDIPSYEVHSTDENPDKKVRKAWFYGVTGSAQMILSMGYVRDPKLKLEIERFVEKYTSRKFQNQRLTTPQDIQAGNKILDKLLSLKR